MEAQGRPMAFQDPHWAAGRWAELSPPSPPGTTCTKALSPPQWDLRQELSLRVGRSPLLIGPATREPTYTGGPARQRVRGEDQGAKGLK